MMWVIYYIDKYVRGGGLYSDSGVKNGYCIELYESFWRFYSNY